jgi:uncharacterized protein involved in exopolysaccharide biosynthesis
LSKFAPTSMKIQDLDRQIEEARHLLAAEKESGGTDVEVANPAHQRLELLLAQAQAQMAALRARAEALRTQIVADAGKLEHLDQIASEQERLDREVVGAKESLQNYTKKLEEARFSDALDESRIVNVSIVEPAAPPLAPLPSKRGTVFGMGVAMSLFAGIGLAFARDRLDPAVKGGAEAQQVTGLPILAEIPL